MMTNLIMPYIIYEHERRMFRVLKSRGEGFSNSAQEVTFENTSISNEPTQVSTIAWNRSTEMDMALRHVINKFFVNLDSLVTNLYLYRSSEDELLKWKLLVQ